MGQLILMPRTDRSSLPVVSVEGGAEILFFTGVRYYRMPDDASAKVIKPRRRRRPTSALIRDKAHQVDCHA